MRDSGATYNFVLETVPARLRALLVTKQCEADPGLIHSFADTLFVLVKQGRIDLATEFGLVCVAFAL